MTRRRVFALLSVALVSACHAADPLPDTYVLGIASSVQPSEVSQLGQPVVEVELARLPDYLDTTDIVLGAPDDRVVASKTGRWGERLSVGVTRAIALSLAARLPEFAVTTLPPLTAPARRVRIDIDAFALRPDGNCVLTGVWAIRNGRDGDLLDKQRIALVVPISGTTDAAVVAAMSREVDTLAERIALALRAGPGRPKPA